MRILLYLLWVFTVMRAAMMSFAEMEEEELEEDEELDEDEEPEGDEEERQQGLPAQAGSDQAGPLPQRRWVQSFLLLQPPLAEAVPVQLLLQAARAHHHGPPGQSAPSRC